MWVMEMLEPHSSSKYLMHCTPWYTPWNWNGSERLTVALRGDWFLSIAPQASSASLEERQWKAASVESRCALHQSLVWGWLWLPWQPREELPLFALSWRHLAPRCLVARGPVTARHSPHPSENCGDPGERN